MKGKDLLEGMGQVDERFVAEAAEPVSVRGSGWKRWAAAACAALVLTGVLLGRYAGGDGGAPSDVAGVNGPTADGVPETEGLVTNPVAGPSGSETAEVALFSDDRRTLTYDQLLAYFGYDALPLETAMPSFVLQTEDRAVYERDGGEIYYDTNTVRLKSEEGEGEIRLTLSRCRTQTGAMLELTGEDLELYQVNGRKLALFAWTNADGEACVYVEFIQHGVAHTVLFKNLSAREIEACLAELVEKGTREQEAWTLTGQVIAIDANTNCIGIRVDNEEDYEYLSVTLPEEASVGEYALGQRLEVVFTGEPITLCHVWPQQLLRISPA